MSTDTFMPSGETFPAPINEIVEKAGWVSLNSLAGATEPEKEEALGSPTHMAS
jgi:hypothetical protein